MFTPGGLTEGLSEVTKAGPGQSVQAVFDALTTDDAPRLIELLEHPETRRVAAEILERLNNAGGGIERLLLIPKP